MIIIILPMMLVGGGNEEVGWQMIVQPELEKKYGFNLATISTAIIWWIWHLPLYFYPSQIQYEWININIFLGIGFIVNCVTNALVYKVIYVISNKKVFSIFFLHMFENIILTGAMIYPFSIQYKIAVIPVSIVIDLLFCLVMTKSKLYKDSLDLID